MKLQKLSACAALFAGALLFLASCDTTKDTASDIPSHTALPLQTEMPSMLSEESGILSDASDIMSSVSDFISDMERNGSVGD